MAPQKLDARTWTQKERRKNKKRKRKGKGKGREKKNGKEKGRGKGRRKGIKGKRKGKEIGKGKGQEKRGKVKGKEKGEGKGKMKGRYIYILFVRTYTVNCRNALDRLRVYMSIILLESNIIIIGMDEFGLINLPAVLLCPSSAVRD